MTFYAVVDDFRAGMPQTTLATPLRPRGIACHTTEGAEGEQGALGTIQFLIDRADRNASYHEIWYAKLDGFEARRIVRPERAAHSMSPAQPPWSPNDRVRRILGDRWYDPNAYSYAVSIAGTTAGTVPNLVNDPGFMAGARRRIAEIRAAYPSLNADPLYNHGEGQTDRSDWGPLMRPAILSAPGGDMPLPLIEEYEKFTTKIGGTFYTDGWQVGAAKQWSSAIVLEAIAKSPPNANGYSSVRLLRYQNDPIAKREVLYADRAGLMVVPGTLQKALPIGAADCTVPINAAKQATADKANAQMDAWTAARPKIAP